MHNRRDFCRTLVTLFLAGGLLLLAPVALAQTYPTKPIRIIVPYAAGGVTDVLARRLAQALTPRFGQPIIIDLKPGGSLIIGAEAAARAAPDGYTLFMGSGTSHAINPNIFPKLPYDPVKDFDPVVAVSDIQYVLCVNESVPAKTLAEFVRYAKSRPGELNFASYGSGTSVHLGMELFKLQAGIDMVHVPFKGNAPADQELASGRVQALITAHSILNFVKQGRVRVLAVTTAKRSPALPEIPTVAESGYPGFEVKSWFGLFVPKGTPKEVVRLWNSEINHILKAPDTAEWMRGMGLEPAGGTPEELAEQVTAESAKWKQVIERAKLKLD
jgi:tripartite-type tricarboxylate transporter receptor subunit TctC